MLAFAALSLPFIAAGEDAAHELQRDIEVILAEEGLTGIAWALIGEAGSVTIGAAGSKDAQSGARFASDTRFHVGSLSKAVLATGVLRLATQGTIDLDAPVQRYLPDLPLKNPWSGTRDVTVRHLLDHTSGLNDAHLWQMFSQRADPDGPLSAAFPDPARQLRIRSRPGARFSYSNMGYTLLGMIIESVTGGRYESYLDEQVLNPLQMRNSTFAYTAQEGEYADPSLAWGHVDGGLRYAASPMFLRPAGQFTTTAGDLARFAEFLLSDGTVRGQVFIRESLVRARGKPAGTEAADAGLAAGYALGLGRRDRHGVLGYCHGGNIVGFAAMLCIFPDQQKAFAYSVNTDSETADYGRFAHLFIETLAVPGALPPSTMEPETDMAQWLGRYTYAPNRFQTFAYLDTVFGVSRISAAGDSLSLTSLQRPGRQLRPVGNRRYSASDRAAASHVFYRGEKGEYLFSDGFQTYEKTSTVYLFAHWVSLVLGLSGLIWILAAGFVTFLRYRSKIFRRSLVPAFLAAAGLFIPIPFFAAQSFMALGDFTLASGLLAAVTLLLPVGMVLTIVRARKTWISSRIDRLNTLAAGFVLQWCCVLAAAGLLPLRLWI